MLCTEIAAFPCALDRLVLQHRCALGVFEDDAAYPGQAASNEAFAAAAGVAATLSAVYGREVTPGLVRARVARARQLRPRLAELLASPGIAQRTDAWYAARRGYVTASDISSALGSAKYGTQKEFYKKKCGAESEQRAFNGGAPPLKWGVMFEPVANAIYCARNRVAVHEFGLLGHRTVPHLGASPDGINELGVMLEIKCPYSRKIDGTVPKDYYYQIQGQLDVCGLDDCDYMECEFEEAPLLLPETDHQAPADARPFGALAAPIDDDAEAARVEAAEGRRAADAFYAACALPHAAEHGVVIERVAADGCTIEYVYSPVGAGASHAEVLRAWEAAELGTAAAAAGTAVVLHRWRLVKVGVVRVTRDPEFVADMLDGLSQVWQRVVRYRGDREAYQAEVLDARRPSSRSVASAASSPAVAVAVAVRSPFLSVEDDD
jgi:putative phage-type endonuclease